MTEAVYRAFSGRKSGPDRELSGMTVADLARTVRAGAGTQKAAAAALGVNVATFRRWERGEIQRPKASVRDALEQSARALVRRARMGPRREQKIRRSDQWTVTGQVPKKSWHEEGDPTRKREIPVGIAGGSLAPALDAYLRGDDAAAAAHVNAAITTHYVSGMTLTEVDAVTIP